MTNVSKRTPIAWLVPLMICLVLTVPLAAAGWSPAPVPGQQLLDAQPDNYQSCPEGILACQHHCDADPDDKGWCRQSCELRCS